MKTIIRSPGGKEVTIGGGLPTVLIGERINPFGKGPLKEAMTTGNMEPIQKEALGQVTSGADALVVSVSAFGVDEVAVLPAVIRAVMDVVDVPLCIETRNREALEAALKLGCGKPVVSSVTGETAVLEALLPLVREYQTALVVLASDASGIPHSAAARVEVIRRILERTDAAGIPREDILADCVAEAAALGDQAVATTLDTMNAVRSEFDLNLVLGSSNVSFGLPGRTYINAIFMGLALRAGLTAAIVSPAVMLPYVMAADVILGRDARARRLTTYYRKQKAAKAGA